MADYEILKTIKSPQDVKDLSFFAINKLCEEMRSAIINRVSKIGGHLGPNLGVVELATALHYVFDAPKDKIVWDVSHQSYPHKMLTGRAEAFYDDKKFASYSGYTAPTESVYDLFMVGHTSTSISLAAGLAKARDLKGENYNVIAIIGDGSLSGGEAFEGLDNVADFASNFIVIVNDNEMSIAENYGGLYGNLAELRRTQGKAKDNYFKALGFDYTYVEEGNDVTKLITELLKVKDSVRPVVLHVHTLKGKGYKFAEENKESFHWTMPFDVETGKLKSEFNALTYAQVVSDYLERRVQQDDKLMVVNAATPGALGLQDFRANHPENYFDVGIAEEHAIAFLSGMAKSGLKPIGLFFGGFIQRAYDQISQDLCLNKSPAIMVIEGTGISSMDATHLGVFDMALLGSIPNLVCLAPTCAEETTRMLDWAFQQKDFPIVIRTPADLPQELTYLPQKEIVLNQSEIVKQGTKIAILGLGNFLKLAEDVAALLQEQGINATIINPRFYNMLDKDMLSSLLEKHHTVITLEDGILDGGYGQKVCEFYAASKMKVYSFGAKKEFTDRDNKEDILKRCKLTAQQIVDEVLA